MGGIFIWRAGRDSARLRARPLAALTAHRAVIHSRSPSTPFLFDFNNVTSIYAYRIDDEPVVLDGGDGCTVTTLSSTVPLNGAYKNNSRNLFVNRCNTTVKNIEHVIYNEPATDGHTYSGFYYAGICYNVEFNNCIAQSRIRCVEGTYDIGVYNAVDVRFINCTQSNFYAADGKTPNTSKCWFIMGSNFSRNITYDGCMLTRFDAHCGVYNATIKNSVTSSIRLTGGGHFYMENTKIIAVRATNVGFIELREDYGSTWRGTIELKNCTYEKVGGGISDTLALISAIWVNHDFGYQTYLPDVVIDNLKFSDNVTNAVKKIEIFSLVNGSFNDNKVDTEPDFEENLVVDDFRAPVLYDKNGNSKENANPYIASNSIIIRNNYVGMNYVKPSHVVFSETEFVEEPVSFGNVDAPLIDPFA